MFQVYHVPPDADGRWSAGSPPAGTAAVAAGPATAATHTRPRPPGGGGGGGERIKMSESQTKAGNQKKIENLKI